MFLLVKRADFLACCSKSDNDLPSIDKVQIKRMEGVPQFDKNIICYVDNIIDRSYPSTLDRTLEPKRASTDRDIPNDTSRVARAA